MDSFRILYLSVDGRYFLSIGNHLEVTVMKRRLRPKKILLLISVGNIHSIEKVKFVTEVNKTQ
ncbi:MAG: hypothetical protein A3G34_11755 [Candidatus Lindowbacteria bacterium RIFCSPLOWO2_12_FULL_62_27]|nr:MAG: hypothetical protein A3G34_11755 [Candidatus Lindowbacteria bacterium RIFCSPLOWO2_12_FULL_62_27]OGH56165.1 MAG: hypothetical protein A3I06_01795 [Candidatus Lindowbacteria bacterium RIFCSPLOWO2_02_FULL_62_12]